MIKKSLTVCLISSLFALSAEIFAHDSIGDAGSFLTSFENSVIDHAVYKNKLFIDAHQFSRYHTEKSNALQSSDNEIVFKAIERDGNIAYLVESSTLYVIKTQSFNPLDLAE